MVKVELVFNVSGRVYSMTEKNHKFEGEVDWPGVGGRYRSWNEVPCSENGGVEIGSATFPSTDQDKFIQKVKGKWS